MVFLTKFHECRAKFIDFFLMAKFWTSCIFFGSHFKRKVEDVPGIFIPQQSKKVQHSESKETVADDSKAGGRISHFLGVKEEHGRRRRHSLSDPALLLKFNSPSKQSAPSMMPTATSVAAAPPPRPSWLANLTPRSPYAKSTQSMLPFSRCCCFLSCCCSM